MSMSKNDTGKYDERHRFWTDQAISQFGTTNQLVFYNKVWHFLLF